MRSVCALLAICLLVPASLFADARTDEKPRTDRQLPRDVEQKYQGLNPTTRGEFTFAGTVLDQSQRPLAGIQVKLFIGGLLAESHATDAVGQYNFTRTIDFGRDETVMLWLVDPSRSLAPKAFVVCESQVARDQRILSPCFTRIQVEKKIQSTVYLFDADTKAKALAEKRCI